MVVEDDIDDVLVAPRDFQFELGEDRLQVTLPVELAHPSQVHQHHARVNAFNATIIHFYDVHDNV